MNKKLVLVFVASVITLVISAAAVPFAALNQSLSRTPSPAETEAIEGLGMLCESPTGSFASHKRYSPVSCKESSVVPAKHPPVGIGNAGKRHANRWLVRSAEMRLFILNHAYKDGKIGERPLTLEERAKVSEDLLSKIVKIGKPSDNKYQCVVCGVTRGNRNNAASHLCREHCGIVGWKYTFTDKLFGNLHNFQHSKRKKKK